MHFSSPKIPWEKTDLPDIIKENLEELRQKKVEKIKSGLTKPLVNKRNRGRRI
ncbi:hypothetical protein [Sphingobacterium faecium]|nr:hypothetical protein [Sphingobacterium faecium]WGQ12829.1 hypothetical protein QG727_12410 [Sphingobacterium faecium]GGE19436.1 hypothetical protein GCM10011516_16420 [Sphingobacterium soli]